MRLVLGSQSPRRRELLGGLGIPFEAVNIHADESFPLTLKAGDIPLYISRAKADAYLLKDDELLITADTIVWIDGQVLGKPVDKEDACRMLRMLSDHTHSVFTGVTLSYLRDGERIAESFVDETRVTFCHLTDQEIQYYVERYRPLDKAGAYGVQEFIGYIGVKHIDGSYYNVMGLPVDRVYQTLSKFFPDSPFCR